MIVEIDEASLSAAPDSDYMNDEQLNFFETKLRELRQQTLTEIDTLRVEIMQSRVSDTNDRASLEEEATINIRIADRKCQLLPKIDAALHRIRQGEYGYCLESGEPIGIARLLIRPTAELSTDIKVLNEKRESNHDN